MSRPTLHAMRARRDAAGFSILEVLAVLAIVGMLAAIVTPSLGVGLASITFERQTDALHRSVSSLRVSATLERRSIEFDPGVADAESGVADAGLERVQDLRAKGWEISGGPVLFLPSGVCLGGEIFVVDPSGRSRTIVLEPPDCLPPRYARAD
ncbi:MAG: type II secretion system protein [Pseudomonadota bacterium]